ncbi:hypothetical protein [Microbacterium sp. NPDC058389]|uniref:hypothetical protein n=1 Tax=Microbacterium sp. NPDC058389 TaxID=3346475 RepID=UPI00365B3059
MTTFGPQLIGETEKALNAILREILAGRGLAEPVWVTVRLAAQASASDDLIAVVAEKARYDDAGELVAAVNRRGLVDGSGITEAGTQLIADVQREVKLATAHVWADLDPVDVAATERVLNAVAERARAVLDARV